MDIVSVVIKFAQRSNVPLESRWGKKGKEEKKKEEETGRPGAFAPIFSDRVAANERSFRQAHVAASQRATRRIVKTGSGIVSGTNLLARESEASSPNISSLFHVPLGYRPRNRCGRENREL